MFKQIVERRKLNVILVLVLLALASVLVAQTTSHKEAAPAESGQVQTEQQDFQTYNGEEYVVYQKNGQTVFYNPATGEEFSKVTTVNLLEMAYQGNLGKQVLVSERKETRDGVPFVFSTYKQTAPNGNVIIYNPVDNRPNVPTVSALGFPDVVLETGERMNSRGEYPFEIIPYDWIDQTHLLVAKGNVPSPYSGIFSLDIVTGIEKEIFPDWESKDGRVIKQEYVEEPYLSPSGRYLIFQKPIGIWSEHDGGKTEPFIYDIQTGSKKKITDEGYPLWLTTKEVSQNPGEPGFSFSSMVCDPPVYCGQSGLTFKFPFKCGEAYRVTRDGENCTPTTCDYTDGGYPTANWNQCCGTAHEGKKAIDFSDNNLGGTGSDNLPVLAAQAGTVKHNGNNDDFGYNVWILHSDGTYTFYCHLKEQSPLVVNASVPQGQILGIEGCTGNGCTGQHIHFARSVVMNGGNNNMGIPNSRWMTFDELGPGKLPMDERVYISKNGSCSDCGTIWSLPACGGTFSGQSTQGFANNKGTYFAPMSNATGGNAASIDMSGPEKVYNIVTTSAGAIIVTLSNVSNQLLAPFILQSGGNCSLTNPLLHGQLGTSLNLTATYPNAPAGSYYIFVDSKNGLYGTYTLKVSVPPVNLTDFGSSRGNPVGRNLPITAKVVNNSTANAPSFYTTFFANTAPNFIGAYPLVNVTYNSGLPANYYSEFAFNWTIPNNIPAGNYYLLEKIDNGNTVAPECNENDNNFYFAGTFYIPPAFDDGHTEGRANDISEIAVSDVNSESISGDEPDLMNVMPIEMSPRSSPVTPTTTTCTAIVAGYDITTAAEPGSRYLLAYTFGRIVCQGKATDGMISCQVTDTGIYFLTIIGAEGDRCTQKIFVE